MRSRMTGMESPGKHRLRTLKSPLRIRARLVGKERYHKAGPSPTSGSAIAL